MNRGPDYEVINLTLDELITTRAFFLVLLIILFLLRLRTQMWGLTARWPTEL